MPFYGLTLRAEKPPDPVYPSELRTLGDHIRARRLDLGLEQKEVARIIGAAECSVWNWENNRGQPCIRFIPRIYGFLGYCPWEAEWSFGQSVRQRREALGLYQKELAQQLGVDPTTVQSWESGEHKPTAESVRRVEAFFARDRLQSS